jgi:PAS domain-containing protein
MIADTDGGVRRWTRIIESLRARGQKVRRHEAAAAGTLDVILEESMTACDGLLQDLAGAHLLSDQLRRELRAETLNRQYLLEQLPMACLATDGNGVIQNANQPAAELFNISAKHLRGRLLLHFSADRPAVGRLLHSLPGAGGPIAAFVPVRPRERGLSKLNALIVPETVAESSSWLWFLKPATADARTSAPSNHSPYAEEDIA